VLDPTIAAAFRYGRKRAKEAFKTRNARAHELGFAGGEHLPLAISEAVLAELLAAAYCKAIEEVRRA
jgi:hypothetical protein